MSYKVIGKENKTALVISDEVLIKDLYTALELIAAVQFETDCNKIIIDKHNLTYDFFDVDSSLKEEILEKLVKFDKKLAIIGDFSDFEESKKSVINKLNQSNNICILPAVEEAILKFKN